MEHLQIKEVPIYDRPREKLIRSGVSYLSDRELIAILLGSGTKDLGVFEISENLVKYFDNHFSSISFDGLAKIKGIGTAKASLILAALEFSRRRIQEKGVKIKSAEDVIPLVRHLVDRPQEYFITISLNGAHEVIATRIVTIGLLNSSQIHPREVFSDPITDRARAIIICHNHPSGNVEPSNEDIRVTKTLRDSGELLGIKVLDHIIFSQRDFMSFREKGLMG